MHTNKLNTVTRITCIGELKVNGIHQRPLTPESYCRMKLKVRGIETKEN